jgi:hypothetical protein
LIIALGRSTVRLDGGGSVIGQRGRHLERDQAVGPAAGLVDSDKGIARGPDIGDRQVLEDLLRAPAGVGLRADVVVIQPTAGDRLLEDGRVRGHAPEAVLGDEPRQLAGGDEIPGDVVIPRALAQLAQPDQRIGRSARLPGHADLRTISCRTIAAARSGVNLNS